MKIAALILLGLGSLTSGGLGIKWLSDAIKYSEAISSASSLGVSTSEITRLKFAAILLLIGLVVGIATIFMMQKGKGKIGGIACLAIVLIAAILTPSSLVGSLLLGIGGGLALMVKPSST